MVEWKKDLCTDLMNLISDCPIVHRFNPMLKEDAHPRKKIACPHANSKPKSYGERTSCPRSHRNPKRQFFSHEKLKTELSYYQFMNWIGDRATMSLDILKA